MAAGMAAKAEEQEVKEDAVDGGKAMESLRSLWWHASTGKRASVERVTSVHSCIPGLKEVVRLGHGHEVVGKKKEEHAKHVII